MKKWLDLMKMILPVVLAQNPKTAVVAPFVIEGIEAAEQLPGAKGAAKAAHAKEIALAAIHAANAEAGRTVVDPDAVSEAIDSGIETGVAVVNVVHGHPTA